MHRQQLLFPAVFSALIILIFVLIHQPGSGRINAVDQFGAPGNHHAPVATADQAVQDIVALRRMAALHLEQAQALAAAESHQDVLQQRQEAAKDREQLRDSRPAAAVAQPQSSYPAPAGTQAAKAVAFAYAQLGCPYVWGGTGPCQSGYDCSGLTQAAWAYAGVSIPRTSESQWASLPHVPMSAIQPGDLIVFDGAGHIGIYVGGGMIIDSPQPGQSVEKIPLSTPWYQQYLVGAVRP